LGEISLRKRTKKERRNTWAQKPATREGRSSAGRHGLDPLMRVGGGVGGKNSEQRHGESEEIQTDFGRGVRSDRLTGTNESVRGSVVDSEIPRPGLRRLRILNNT